MRAFTSTAAVKAAVGAVALLGLICPASAQQPTQAQASAIRSACRADYQAHCSSVPTGGSAALQCLQQNAPELSGGCQQALSAISGGAGAGAATASPGQPPQARPLSQREQVAILRADCGADYREFCHGVRPGGGRAIACLQSHGSQLSHQCSSALLAARQSK